MRLRLFSRAKCRVAALDRAGLGHHGIFGSRGALSLLSAPAHQCREHRENNHRGTNCAGDKNWGALVLYAGFEEERLTRRQRGKVFCSRCARELPLIKERLRNPLKRSLAVSKAWQR
eukprot:CAMPEP_0202055426 /NCGR_PEP_ID=MMETSP0963-20130614/18327_1 /ASSEMBLY_ACC=CAM_ASM_000494 /TAXON_ID=4773 /ORGANISM="Schizochytrium aggregatum, Strain ATCC28209" /LENGTH=116 /DNA_ID=CAMNT_0048621029 /DNA_START=80 /DNA_END=430 /DNA_ORIENTATION=+